MQLIFSFAGKVFSNYPWLIAIEAVLTRIISATLAIMSNLGVFSNRFFDIIISYVFYQIYITAVEYALICPVLFILYCCSAIRLYRVRDMWPRFDLLMYRLLHRNPIALSDFRPLLLMYLLISIWSLYWWLYNDGLWYLFILIPNFVIVLVTLLYELVPPAVLFLAVSSPESLRLQKQIEDEIFGLRVVSLLDFQTAYDDTSPSLEIIKFKSLFSAINPKNAKSALFQSQSDVSSYTKMVKYLSQAYPSDTLRLWLKDWESFVFALMNSAKIIVIDMRTLSKPVLLEATMIIADKKIQNTIFVSNNSDINNNSFVGDLDEKHLSLPDFEGIRLVPEGELLDLLRNVLNERISRTKPHST
jgi:hypothetical protein